MSNKYLTKEEIRERTPAVFATSPSPKVSDKYSFMPTENLLDAFLANDWYPVNTKQCSRGKGRTEHAFHELRFRTKKFLDMEMVKGQLIPELVLSTSHLATNAFRLDFGLYRLVCSNGMIVNESEVNGVKLIHKNNPMEQVSTIVSTFIEDVKKQDVLIQEYTEITLSKEQKIAFAQKLITERFKGQKFEGKIDYIKAIEPVRSEDQGDDLWRVFNTLQEKVVNGGLVIKHENNKITTSKQLTNAHRDNVLNRSMWAIMVAYAARFTK